VRYGKLDTMAVDSLQALPLELDYQPEGHNEGLATYFREHLRQEVLDILEAHPKPDGTPYNLYRDGLKIFTTIDSRLQSRAEAAVAREMPDIQAQFAEDWKNREPYPERALQRALENSPRYQALRERGWSREKILAAFEEPTNMTVFDWRGGAVDTVLTPLDSLKHYLTLLNAGLLAVEPGTGLIKVWVGGIDHRFIQYDHVMARRQIGSTMKPIVYTAALQSGMLPCEYTPNELKSYEEFEGWTPHNSEGEYGGAYSLEGALARSINTIAVELALRAGLENVQNLAHEMGINGRIPKVPAIALGAVDASLWEMATVYSTFANRGYRPNRLHYLDRIETADGEVIIEFNRPRFADFERVLYPGHADMMLHLLQGVVDSGTAQRLRTVYGISGPYYGKTGTTQDQRDGWFVGFNSSLVTSAWVGAENPDVHFRTLYRGQSSRTALPVAGRFLRNVYRDRQLRNWRGEPYPTPPDTVLALMQCPPYLPEMPIVEDWEGEYFEIIAWSKAIQDIPSGQLDTLLRDRPRRPNEPLGEYADRIRRVYERRERRDDRREQLKQFWVDELFSGDKPNGG
ncbi:MAG: penicillin-binding protein, partial [Lewinella sp.]|nr:penicillin-binding protein [Lewinella sp.]